MEDDWCEDAFHRPSLEVLKAAPFVRGFDGNVFRKDSDDEYTLWLEGSGWDSTYPGLWTFHDVVFSRSRGVLGWPDQDPEWRPTQ